MAHLKKVKNTVNLSAQIRIILCKMAIICREKRFVELVPAVLFGEVQFKIGVNAANLSVIHSRPPHFPPQNPNLLKNNIFTRA